MPTNYAGVATSHATIPLVANADVPSAAGVSDPMARLMDLYRFGELRTVALEADSPGVAGADQTVVIPIGFPHIIAPAGQFGAALAGIGVEQKLVALAGQMIFNLPLQNLRSGRIKAISLVVQGGAGHGGVLPTVKPSFTLQNHDDVGVLFTAVGAATDAPASAAAYEAAHRFGVTGLAHFIDPARRYALLVTGETGGSAIAGLQIACVELTVGP